MFPHEEFHSKLVQALKSSGRTIPGLGHFLSAENDKAPRTNEQKVRRLLKRLSPEIIDLICLLDSIGLRLQIVPRDAIDARIESNPKPTTTTETKTNGETRKIKKRTLH